MPRWSWVGLSLLLLSGCADRATRPPQVARIDLVPGALSLTIAQARGEVAEAYATDGTRLTGVPVAWVSSDPLVATVGNDGLVTAIGEGQAVITASTRGVSASAAVTVARARVARVVLAPLPADLLAGGSATVRATPLDASDTQVPGWTPRFSVADPTIAQVSDAGVVTALRDGSTMLRVVVDTVQVEHPLRVHRGVDLAIQKVSFAQVVQDDTGSIPMILGGGLPIAVNVHLTADVPVPVGAWVRARCLTGATVRWEDSVQVAGPFAATADPLAPDVQFLFPSSRAGLAMRCVAEVDPSAATPDSMRGNNRWPREGDWSVTAIEVPPLELTFVPVVLSADGGATGNVSAGNLDEYLGTVRQLLPVGRINARVGAAYATTTLFGNGGDVAWRALLRELEAKRVLDGARGHYYGVVRPGTGVTSVTFGGFGYLSGWTALGVQVGWFTRAETARETVAHELGHNFGRPHAPCGGAASPDAEYPYANAAVGVVGWDVASAVASGSTRARAMPSDLRDLMGYCRPAWISDYTYRKMIAGRSELAARSGSSGGSALLVRGEVTGAGASVDPLLVVDAAPTASVADGVLLEVLGADGAVLARHRAPRMAADHGADARSFVAVVPLPAEAVVQAVRVVSGGQVMATRLLDRPAGDLAVGVARQPADGRLRLTWDARQSGTILVRDATTGEVRAIATGGNVTLPAGTGAVQVAFSNGTRARVLR